MGKLDAEHREKRLVTRQLVQSAFSVTDRAIWEESYTRPTRWPHSRTIETVRN
jgi:hypothetical protein